VLNGALVGNSISIAHFMNTDSLYQQIDDEFKRHLVDCHDSKRAHFDLADYYYERANMLYYLQSFGLTVITAWLLSTQFEGFLPKDNSIVRATPTVLAIIVSVLTIVEYVFRFKDKAVTHEQAAKRYHTLWRSCKNWKTDFPDSSTIEQARLMVQKYREQLNDINRDAPHLSSVLWRKIEKMRAKSGNKDVSKYLFEEEEKRNDIYG
jgi:hypothetical protein